MVILETETERDSQPVSQTDRDRDRQDRLDRANDQTGGRQKEPDNKVHPQRQPPLPPPSDLLAKCSSVRRV